MKSSNQKAFTLVETITGIVVIAVISTCSWLAVSTLFRGDQIARNRIVAVNLLQKSQEEVRKASLSFYDKLETCQFPDSPSFNGSNIACGLQNVGANFNSYTRSVTASPLNSSSEIKRAIVTVNWTDQGKNYSLTSAVLLARPPDPLPGNIMGTVRSSGNGNPLINGATIKVKQVSGTAERDTRSTNALGAKKGENFDYFDPSTGAFLLPVGTWRLTATHPSYKNYTHSEDISVTSNAETRVDFQMEPNPQDGIIKIRMIDGNTRNVLPSFSGGRVQVLEKYKETGVYWPADNVTTWSKTINFKDTNPRNFTVDTWWAYRSGYVAKTLKKGAPNCSYEYNPTGWSSAVMLDDTSTLFACANPYHGSAATDRFTLNPGETINVDVPLFPIPLATITGHVTDSRGNALPDSVIKAWWPVVDNTQWSGNGGPASVKTDPDGKFTFTVPAVQEMFSNDDKGALKLRAEHNMPFNGCCDTSSQILKNKEVLVKDLFKDSIINVDIEIPDAGDTTCGNVKGVMKDALSGLALNGVSISIQSVGTTTAGAGDYIYQCPNTGYRLPVGAARFYATKNATHYPYDSGGNTYYSAAANVNIKSKEIVDYDGKLWPFGFGKITVKVIDKGTRLPIKGALVKVVTYNNWQQPNATTAASGEVSFSGVLETWPPLDLPNDAFYNNRFNKLLHTISVTDTSGFYPAQSRATKVLERNGEIEEIFELAPKGGT